jgi:hypothetical protein
VQGLSLEKSKRLRRDDSSAILRGHAGQQPAGAQAKSNIGRMFLLTQCHCSRARGSLELDFNEASEDVPRSNAKAVGPRVIPANVHQPDETALPATRNRKCPRELGAVELLVVVLPVHLPRTPSVFQRLDEP